MVTRTSAVSAIVAILIAGLVAACTPRPDGPGPVAEEFLAALSAGDTSAAAALSDTPDVARDAMNAAWAGLQAERMETQLLGARFTEDTGTVGYRYTWHLPKDRAWSYDGQLKMVRDEGSWRVRWSTTDLHPKLGENQTFALRATPAERATVNEVGGSNVLVPGFLYRYSLDAKQAGPELMRTARAVVRALHPFDDTLADPQLLAEQASSLPAPRELITLRKDDNDRVAPMLAQLPGVVVTPQAEVMPADESFAPAIINQVKQAVAGDLDGQPGWRVVTVNQNGIDAIVLDEVAPTPAPAITISLDRLVQNAAQSAVNTRGGSPAMLVAIRPSTGEILAVAQNAAADTQGPLATTGLFPPGSTFKMVTAGAAMDRAMATPNTMVGCPGTIDIAHRVVSNYNEFDLGVVPMSRAFASSCNTTFAELASRMPPRGLTQAAARYGIGRDYQVEGIATVTGSVPATVDLAERTEDGFGQGRVLVSPFGAALAAATVAAGTTPVPQLIRGRPTQADVPAAPISPDVLDGLRPMMRLVVTNGTAHDIADAGVVFGKTGEAEYEGGSHSWFAGYRGDLAFASLIIGGGSSEYAVRMTKIMLDELPEGFLT